MTGEHVRKVCGGGGGGGGIISMQRNRQNFLILFTYGGLVTATEYQESFMNFPPNVKVILKNQENCIKIVVCASLESTDVRYFLA